MFKLMLFLHLATAIFLVGPLVHFATTAARGLRENDASATASSARGARIYANISLLVLVFAADLDRARQLAGPAAIAMARVPSSMAAWKSRAWATAARVDGPARPATTGSP